MTELLLHLFVKDHENTASPHVRSAIGSMAGFVGIGCNVLLFALKLLAGTLAGSVSITADALNNLSDASGSIVTLVGFKMAGKPAKVLEGIVMGKLGKFYDANCLVEQAYVKEDNMKVSAYVANTAKALGGDIKVVAFYRYDKGEGLQKREENFGDEIANMLGGKA